MIIHDDDDNEVEVPSPVPRLGPCGICGWHPDQRHRIRDTQWSRIIAGEPVADVAADYDWSVEQMQALWHDIDDNLVEMARGEESC